MIVVWTGTWTGTRDKRNIHVYIGLINEGQRDLATGLRNVKVPTELIFLSPVRIIVMGVEPNLKEGEGPRGVGHGGWVGDLLVSSRVWRPSSLV